MHGHICCLYHKLAYAIREFVKNAFLCRGVKVQIQILRADFKVELASLRRERAVRRVRHSRESDKFIEVAGGVG